MSILNVFGLTPPPGAYTMYGDGAPGVTLGQSFTTYGGALPDAQCVGGRVYVPSIALHPHTSKITIMAWLGTDLTAAPARSVQVDVVGTGWVEATWAPLDLPSEGQPITIGYRFTGTEFGPNDYIHTPTLRADGSSIRAFGDVGLELASAPSTYLLIGGTQTAQPSNVGYGIDIIVEGSPVAPNVGPTGEAGINRIVFVGQPVTLAGSGTDSDGTIASYDWSQLSGPPVSLSGTGANRTFTPASPGTYVFALQVTDDDDATSAPDTVTISAVPAPVDGSSTGTARRVAKIGSVERALMALFVRDLEVLNNSDAKVGGEFPREVDDFYIRIDRGPGGRTTSFEGDYNVDIEVFSADYLRAEDVAEDVEALLLATGYHTVVTAGKKWVFDGVFQNVGITDIPWEGDSDVNRLVATYAFTVRRGRA